MDVHAVIQSKRTATVTPCIHFLHHFRGDLSKWHPGRDENMLLPTYQ